MGFILPMDDALAQVAIDFGGRSWLVWDAEFKREYVGDMPTEMFMHFFKSFADAAQANLNIKAEGDNEHHKIESIFKGFSRAIKSAIRRDAEKVVLPSTKGQLCKFNVSTVCDLCDDPCDLCGLKKIVLKKL